ncbi:phage tail sheath family protein [Halobium palmae]|uniref:Phage tail sheath family protein n=1 Tax=Halobium palmae TaxID=1776492 RepID=A0ABD5RYX8_9EURY
MSVTDVDGNATLTVPVVASGVVMEVAAVGPGRWGQRIALTFGDASLYRPGTNELFKLTVSYWSDDATVSDAKRLGAAFSLADATPPDTQEVYDNLSPDESAANYYRDRINDGSNLVEVTPRGSGRPPTVGTTWLAGNFGAVDPQVGLLDFRGDPEAEPGERTGLAAFEELRDVSIVSIPDEHSYGDYLLTGELVAHCEQPALKDRVAVLQSPQGPFQSDGFDGLDSKYAAYYYPWVVIHDPTTGAKKLVPPGGHVAGIFARSDTERGVHKAPANEVVRGVVELPFEVTDGDQAALNPQGVNCIRSFRGRGIRLWGARTVSSDPEWKYVNVRRLFIYIEQSIDLSTQWVVFEPNNEQLWARVRQTVANFLNTVWRDGALMGTTPEEAYYVKCDRSTMTQADIDNGKLIVEIGVAPTKPAEFVVFRLSQWTAGAEGA